MRKSHTAIAILIIASISLFAVGSFLYAVEPSLQVKWSQNYSEGYYDLLKSAEMTSDGGFIMAGIHSRSFYNASGSEVYLNDFWLQKVDSYGNLEWSKTYPSTNDSSAYSVHQTTDGGFIIAGMTGTTVIGLNSSFFLMKVDQNGNEEWNKTFLGGDLPWGYSVQTTDGGYILTGGDGVHVIKTYSNGSLQWSRSYSIFDSFSQAIIQTSDGGYIVLGYAEATLQGFGEWLGIMLLKIDAMGNPQWNRTIASTEYAECFPSSILETSDGGYLVSGTTHRLAINNNNSLPTLENSQAFLLKLYSNGTTQWNDTFNTAETSTGMVVGQTSDGGYISTISAPWGLGSSDWLWKTDSNGKTLWYKPIGSTVSVFYLQQTADGDYVLAGYGIGVAGVLMKVSSSPPIFPPEVIPILFIASGDCLVALIVVGISLDLMSMQDQKKKQDASSLPSR
jgi:hypothetical protein